ncbi:MAG: response regulator transcription factor [Clostridia bacterium]|nr:response regulator transcription factor [Clostridia bacterium]MBR3917671.1 response regulator transcription factor [Clostridia bacterium]
MRILYAEDERGLSEAVVDILTYHHYTVDAVYDGETALAYAQLEEYDGIILDIMMPDKSGLEVLKELRKLGYKTPIMLLTAKAEIKDQILGLDTGADDYLPKPFSMELLLAHVRALLRRRPDYIAKVLMFGNVELDQESHEMYVGNQSTSLGKLEYQLMELMMLNHGRYFSTEELLCKVWGYDTEAQPGVVWVYISYLRKKLADLNADIKIVLKRDVGYTLEAHK